MIVYDTIDIKEVMKMKESTKVLTTVDKDFLKKVDEHWKKLNFKNRSEYLWFLVRNDVNNKAV
jgi:metal-responsive CopG/Arc/MetJ family transcriptional regulator